MTDTQQRLIRCFRAVFPELASDDEARRARASSVAAWDSLATVILAAAVEEEFDIQVDPGQLERLSSFESYASLLAGLSHAGAGVPSVNQYSSSVPVK